MSYVRTHLEYMPLEHTTNRTLGSTHGAIPPQLPLVYASPSFTREEISEWDTSSFEPN